MFREKYHSMNEQISPDKELVNKIIGSLYETKKEKNKTRNFFGKPAIIPAIFVILILTVTPVLAANVPVIYKLMHLVSPAVAQFFTPVQISCVDNSIKMEVVSAYIHDDTAEIYITMQDLTGDRIDETTDLYDCYSINPPFSSTATCQRIGYDEKTKKVTFLISITELGAKKLLGDKISFSVRKFISDKHEYNEIPVAVDFTNISNTKETQLVSANGGSGPEFEQYIPDLRSKVKVLVPSAPMAFPVEGIDFTGIGYVDGMLHLQTSVVNNLTKDNHGYFFFRDINGNKVEYIYQTGFVENPYNDNRIDLTEYVFDIPQDEIGQYSLYGTFVTSGSFTEGNWQVTFHINDIKDK